MKKEPQKGFFAGGEIGLFCRLWCRFLLIERKNHWFTKNVTQVSVSISVSISMLNIKKKNSFSFWHSYNWSREPEPTKNSWALRRCCTSWQVKHVYLHIILITWCRPWSGAWWERGGSCCWQDGGWTRLLLQQKDHFSFLRLLGL